jgi:glutamate mutase epsilon subunit
MEKVRTKLEEAIIDMYTHLHMFQDIAAIIIDQHRMVQTKLTQFNTIQEGMNNIDTWITENLDAPVELYHPSVRERKTNIYALDHSNKRDKNRPRNN